MKSIALLAALFAGGAAAAQDVSGRWQSEPADSGGVVHVDIGPCGAALCGVIAAAFDDTGTVVADYEHVGKRMIWDMAPEGGANWSGGRIWAPDRDKTYRAKMELASADRLKVSGCVAGGLICRAQTWVRVK